MLLTTAASGEATGGAPTAQFKVGGMSCSFCVESIHKAYQRMDGVLEASVSMSHEEALVRYVPHVLTEHDIKQTLRDLGYTIRDPDKVKAFEEQQAELETAKHRLWQAGALTLAALGLMAYMWAQMGVYVGAFPGGFFTDTQQPWMGWLAASLALATMFGPGWYIKKKAYQSARRGILNQHVLLEFAAFGGLLGGGLGLATFYSSGAVAILGPRFPIVHFFAVAVFVTAYHILSGYASLLVRTRASASVQKLMDLAPETAVRLTEDGREEEVPVENLAVGDVVRVKPGGSIPVDGEILEGASGIDESIVTGESIPTEKEPGDEVVSGSINQTGSLKVQVTKTGEDRFINQVARHVEEARAMKPSVMQLADVVMRYFVPGVLLVATAALAFWTSGAWLFWNAPLWGRAAFATLAVLVLGYPCALGMATPLALVRGGGMAADRGILMRSGDAFQVLPEASHILLDKTGTITLGEPAVQSLEPAGERSADEVLAIAAAAEAGSQHPLADAILQAADEGEDDWREGEAFASTSGKGVKATLDEEPVIVGKPAWVAEQGIELSPLQNRIRELEQAGNTVVAVAHGRELVGLVAIADEVKDDAKDAIRRFKAAGLTPVMITGDNERTARAVAHEVGIDPGEVLAGVLPDQKAAQVRRLQNEGHRVVFVGDGINDAPALMQADVGMAIGAGTDIAIDSSDVVIMGEKLGTVADAYFIGKNSYAKTKQNLGIAFSFNGVGVPLAATGLVHPIFAMVAMVGSVTAVLANSFLGRLAGRDVGALERAEDQPRPSVIELEAPSMHCGGCAKRVDEGLSGLKGVERVEVDLETKHVRVRLQKGSVSQDRLIQKLEELGFPAGEG